MKHRYLQSQLDAWRELGAQLDAWRDEPARVWNPRVGNLLMGELAEYRRGESSYGPVWVAHVRNEKAGGLVAVWLTHTELLNEFRRLRPEPRERIALRRLDDGGQEGQRYHRYALMVECKEDGGVPDFDADGPAFDAAAADLEAHFLSARDSERTH